MGRSSPVIIAAVVLLLIAGQANAQLLGLLGIGIVLNAGLNTISYASDGLIVTLNAAASTTVTLQAVSNPPAPLCTGCTRLPLGALGGTCGYTIASSGGAISNVQIVTGALFWGSANPISPSAPVACLRQTGSSYQYIAVTNYNSATTQTTATVSGAGTYIFAAVASNINAALGSAVALCANSPQTINFGTSVALQLASSVASNALVCTTSTTPTVGGALLAQAGVSIGAFINFAMTAGAFTGVVSYVYTAAQLSAVGCNLAAGATLRVSFFDAAGCGCWVTPTSGLNVNVGLNLITQVVASGSVILPIGIFCVLPVVTPPPAPTCNITIPPLPAPTCVFCTGTCPPLPPPPANCPPQFPPAGNCPPQNPTCGNCPALPPPPAACPALPPPPAQCPALPPPCALCPPVQPPPAMCPALPPPCGAPQMCPPQNPVCGNCPALPPPPAACPALPPPPAACPPLPPPPAACPPLPPPPAACPPVPPPCALCPALPPPPAPCPALPPPPAPCPALPPPPAPCPALPPPAAPCPACPAPALPCPPIPAPCPVPAPCPALPPPPAPCPALPPPPAPCPALPPPPAPCPALPPPPAPCPACTSATGPCPSCPPPAGPCPAMPPPCGLCPACPVVPVVVPGCVGPAPNLLGSVICLGGSFSIGGILSGTLGGILGGGSAISISVLASAPAPVPLGCVPATFIAAVGGGLGLQIQAAASGALMSNAVVTTPPCTAASIQAMVAAGSSPAVFVLSQARIWNRVAISTFNSATGQCTFTCGSACTNIGAQAAIVLVAAASASVPAAPVRTFHVAASTSPRASFVLFTRLLTRTPRV